MIPAKTIHTKDGTIGHWPPTEYTRKTTSSAIRQISAVVIPLYIFAIICALAHLFFFRHLDGRRLEIDTSIPQSWIAPISFLIGIAFRAALCSCLTIAFAQHLWRVMMKSFLSLQAIDRLYSLQRQFFTLFHLDNFRASPFLVAIMCIYWLTPIAVIFPSGALIVEGKPFPRTLDAKVAHFDPAYYGNGSFEDALKYSLAPNDDLYLMAFEGPVITPNILLSSAAISMVSDQIYSSPSPCGANCTYSIDFQGPYVKCDQSSYNETFDGRAILMEIQPFSGSWNNDTDGWKRPDDAADGEMPFVPDNFTFRTQVPVTWWVREEDTDLNVTFTVTPTTNLTCTPGRANYKVDVNYTSGVPTYKVDTQPVDSLIDFWYSGQLDESQDGSFSFNNSENGVNNLRATNLWLLIDSLVDTLEGRVVCTSRADNGTEVMLENVKSPNNGIIKSTNSMEVYCYMPNAENGTIIGDTPFNTRRFARGNESPEFVITQDLLNEALVNITISAMNRLQLWSTTTRVTQNEWANYYRFATPTRLIVSYFGALALALPFLILGFLSLRSNGAVAPTVGLVDMLVLGAKSEAILDAIKDRSFEHMQQQDEKDRLQTLQVRYGEFGDHFGSEKAPGLGLEHELKPGDISRRTTAS